MPLVTENMGLGMAAPALDTRQRVAQPYSRRSPLLLRFQLGQIGDGGEVGDEGMPIG